MDIPLLEGKQNSWNFGQGPKSEKHLLEQWQVSSMMMVPFPAQVRTILGDPLKVLDGI